MAHRDRIRVASVTVRSRPTAGGRAARDRSAGPFGRADRALDLGDPTLPPGVGARRRRGGGDVGALSTLLGARDAELAIALGQQHRVELAVVGEAHHQLRHAGRHARIAVGPQAPGLRVGAHQARRERVLGGLGQARRDEQAGLHLVDLAVPVRLLLVGERREPPFPDHVLDAGELGARAGPVEQQALQHVLGQRRAVLPDAVLRAEVAAAEQEAVQVRDEGGHRRARLRMLGERLEQRAARHRRRRGAAPGAVASGERQRGGHEAGGEQAAARDPRGGAGAGNASVGAGRGAARAAGFGRRQAHRRSPC